MLLVCNDTPALETVLDGLGSSVKQPGRRLEAFVPRLQLASAVRDTAQWRESLALLENIG